MKGVKVILISLLVMLITVFSCKTVGRIAAKYWLNKEIKEFVSKCEDKGTLIIGSENAHKYCDCAVDLVAEKYQDYKDAKNLSIMEIIDFINKCK